MNNKKAFTLIELLAVIIILGLLMAIAIPSISKYIEQSRKKTYINTAQSYVDSLSKEILSGNIRLDDETASYYIPFNCIPLERGGKSPNGDWDFGYVGITINNGKRKYYIYSKDVKGMGIASLEMNKLKYTDVETITTGKDDLVSLEGKSNVLVVPDSCDYSNLIATVGIGGLPNTAEIQYLNQTPATNATACQINGSDFTHFIDKRNTKEYPVTQIGTQCWMAADLEYTTSACLEATWVGSPYTSCAVNQTGTYVGATHYQWDVANEVCPTGWNLPTDEQWKTLEQTLGMSSSDADADNWRGTDQGTKLKGAWSNTVGFNALLTGYHHYETGDSSDSGTYGSWWSSSAHNDTRSWRRHLNTPNATIFRSAHNKAYGFSVRCLLGP